MATLAEPTAALKLLDFPDLFPASFLLAFSENCMDNVLRFGSTVINRNYPYLPL